MVGLFCWVFGSGLIYFNVRYFTSVCLSITGKVKLDLEGCSMSIGFAGSGLSTVQHGLFELQEVLQLYSDSSKMAVAVMLT